MEYIQVFYLNQLEVGIDDLVRIRCCDFIDAVTFHVVPKLNVISVHEIEVHTVLAVLSYNHKGGVVPNMPGLFVKTEGVENFYGGYVFDHGNMCLLECKMYPRFNFFSAVLVNRTQDGVKSGPFVENSVAMVKTIYRSPGCKPWR